MTRFGLATVLVALSLAACGIGESVTSRCLMEEDAYQTAKNKQNGLLVRGISRKDVAFRGANEGARRALRALRTCEDGRGMTGVLAVESGHS